MTTGTTMAPCRSAFAVVFVQMIIWCYCTFVATAFQMPPKFSAQLTTFLTGATTMQPSQRSQCAAVVALSATAAKSPLQLFVPNERDQHYGSNVAQYLIDLHDSQATFNFCGGMMFQLVLSQKLHDHLSSVAAAASAAAPTPDKSPFQHPIVFDAAYPFMRQIPDYSQSSHADNIKLFHGREIRQVPDAAGGMGFVLQLSLANSDDPEGWTTAEIKGYDGWKHDGGRVWRNGPRLEEEGFTGFRQTFGPTSFALHHRFYLHYDNGNRIWLSAEDGCEGFPAASSGGVVDRIASLMNLANGGEK